MNEWRIKVLMLVSAFLFWVGCSPNQNNSSPPSKQLSGDEIWANCRQAYKSAKAYRDEAVIYLSYRMHGQLIQEPQPWSVAWTNAQKVAANFFNTQLRSDGTQLSCFVYDNDTANLDNQWLLIEQQDSLPLNRLAQDQLAKYFFGGYSEFPLDESPASPLPTLVPPTVGWLTEQLAWGMFDTPRLIERLKDAKVDDRPCYHLNVHGDQLSSEMWIDQESKLVRQMTLPVELLDPAVRSAVEVSEIQFFARFHQAQFNPPLAETEFAMARPKSAVAVQQFISLPEPFPCGLIGEAVEDLPLFEKDGQLQQIQFKERPTVLFWTSGLIGQEVLSQIKTLRTGAPGQTAQWIGVFSDDQCDPNSKTSRQLVPELRDWLDRNQIDWKWAYDAHLNASQHLKLDTLPAAVVVSKTGVVQYAVALGAPQWHEHLIGALQRVIDGESVAEEMLADYRSYLDRYQRRLRLVSADRNQLATGRDPGNSLSILSAKVRWKRTDFKQPGNLYPFDQHIPNSVLAFDGWQSIVSTDLEGKPIQRLQLDVPEGVALNMIRQAPAGQLPLGFAAFSVFGHAVFLFDSDWKLLKCLTKETGAIRDNVLDCCFHLTEDGRKSILVAWENSGLQEFDLERESWRSESRQRCDSLVSFEDTVAAVSESKLMLRSPNADWVEVPGIRGNAVRVELFQLLGAPPAILVSSVSDAGVWQLSKLSMQGEVLAVTEIGPQLFESPVEPAGFTQNGGGYVVWADSLNRVQVFDWNLTPLGTWQAEHRLYGLKAIWHNGHLTLLASAADGIQSVEIELPLRQGSRILETR